MEKVNLFDKKSKKTKKADKKKKSKKGRKKGKKQELQDGENPKDLMRYRQKGTPIVGHQRRTFPSSNVPMPGPPPRGPGDPFGVLRPRPLVQSHVSLKEISDMWDRLKKVENEKQLKEVAPEIVPWYRTCLLYTSPSPRDRG